MSHGRDGDAAGAVEERGLAADAVVDELYVALLNGMTRDLR